MSSDLEMVAVKIRQICRTSGFARRLSVGQLLFDGLFAGCILEWHDRGSFKHSSLRRLAELVRGTMSKSELHRSVSAYVLCRRLPFVPTSGQLTVSHVEAVEGVSFESQELLLRRAEAEAWSVRQLRQAKRDLCGGEWDSARPARAGRIMQAFGQSARLAKELAQELAVGSRGSALSGVEVPDFLVKLDELALYCRTLRAALQGRQESAELEATERTSSVLVLSAA